jgi:hypothetical protein
LTESLAAICRRLLTLAAIRARRCGANIQHGARALPAFSFLYQYLRTMIRKAREQNVGEWIGVSIALLSSSLGGTAAAITRYLVSGADPVALAILRWGIGFLCVLPAALLIGVRWPERGDWLQVAALGLSFFGLFFILYNIAISYTTAARATWHWRRFRCTPWWLRHCSASSP